MLQNVTRLKDFTIKALDGNFGRMVDCYFDDKKWTIRYIVVQTSEWLAEGSLVLISPVSIIKIDWEARQLEVNLTKDKIKHSPGIETDMPVSMQHEIEYFKYYGWEYYWNGSGLWGPMALPAEMYMPKEPPLIEEALDTPSHHLRSTAEVLGYHIHATDKAVGHIDDFIFDENTWQINYLEINTSIWWFGKKTLITPQLVSKIEWEDTSLYIKISSEDILNSPEYDPGKPIEEKYINRLDHYYKQHF